MVKKVYCDTNIFIDFFDKRTDRLRPLNQFAFQFFSKGWNCAFSLVVSDWLLEELRRHLKEEQIQEIFEMFKSKNKLIFIKEEQGDRIKAYELSNHWDDALHAVLARKAGADFLS